ncbi:hypothetical protein GCM10010329_34300 [Streptomyces spiroverticillatus]|uniref:DUF4162 domain-containing protein n=1 Tax=Streptomyces finlayi TaxID=67296 RepID=A0A918WWR1_9ACTN|nr:hypothetical protein [Streptomyces finlayi]GHA08654.1 hypothetical protein GCM10010329_34300 [Streptomyces spiroverticillatus]GHC91563.1 hypothetical protein GCM10010334_26710 [Streptomyces finlayi]
MVDRGRIKALGEPGTLGGRAEAAAVVSRRENGREVRQETPEPDRLVAELMARNAHNSARVEGLSVHRPSLEDVYLRMIDEAAPERDESLHTRKASA